MALNPQNHKAGSCVRGQFNCGGIANERVRGGVQAGRRCMAVSAGMSEEQESRLDTIRKDVAAYAKARADLVYLDEYRKSHLAILMKEYEAKGFSAVSAQEREGRADPRYIVTLQGLREATEIAEQKRWELKIVEMQFEKWRTQEATRRAEKSRYGA